MDGEKAYYALIDYMRGQPECAALAEKQGAEHPYFLAKWAHEALKSLEDKVKS